MTMILSRPTSQGLTRSTYCTSNTCSLSITGRVFGASFRHWYYFNMSNCLHQLYLKYNTTDIPNFIVFWFINFPMYCTSSKYPMVPVIRTWNIDVPQPPCMIYILNIFNSFSCYRWRETGVHGVVFCNTWICNEGHARKQFLFCSGPV